MILKKIVKILIFLAIIAFLISGCLTTQTKEYRFQINTDGSGKGTIKFINIISEDEDSLDVAFNDFGELIHDYLEGHAFEDENPSYNVVDKKLYEQDSLLVGEIVFTFDSMNSVGFYRDSSCQCSPVMFYLGSISETLLESNGFYPGGQYDFPVILWNPDIKEFFFKTVIKENLSGTRNLLPFYRNWKTKE